MSDQENRTVNAASAPASRSAKPSPAQRAWLIRGLNQAGGKLPLFDLEGRAVSQRTIMACIQAGWAERWLDNPIKPDWLVCRLTAEGRIAVTAEDG